MAKKKTAVKTPPELKDLPKRRVVWQVDARPLEIVVKFTTKEVHPWVVIVVNITDGEILALEMLKTAPTPKKVRDVVVQAMTRPGRGKPHLPNTIQVIAGKRMKALEDLLAETRVRCNNLDEVDVIDEVLDQLVDELDDDDYQPGLLDTPDITPRIAASFFTAAAAFFEKEPWTKVGERTIRVESPKSERGPWYAVMMGQAGSATGIVLYDNRDFLHEIKQGKKSDEEVERLTSALAVVYGQDEDLLEADLESIRLYGWKVAGPDAYPWAYRKQPGLSMRPPDRWELELLEACLRAIPDFVKLRQTKPVEIEVGIANGKLPLKLSWEK